MAARLGIIEAFQETLELCWKRLPALMRVIWAPTLLFMIAELAFVFVALVPGLSHAIEGVPKGPDGQPNAQALQAAIDQSIFAFMESYVLVFGLLGLAYVTMIAVPISRLAGAGEEPVGVFFVRWSARHTRFAISYAVYVLLPVLVGWAIIAFLISSGHLEGLRTALENIGTGQADPQSLRTLDAEMSSANIILFLAGWVVGVLLLTLPPIAAIEDRIRLGGALRMGFRHFLPITGGLILIYLAGLALTIAFIIVFGIYGAVAVGVVTLLKPLLIPTAISVIAIALGITAFVAVFAFNCFYYGLWIAYPAVVYRRLSAESA